MNALHDLSCRSDLGLATSHEGGRSGRGPMSVLVSEATEIPSSKLPSLSAVSAFVSS